MPQEGQAPGRPTSPEAFERARLCTFVCAAAGVQDAPLLHLSHHDGMHWNSVRAADDYSSGPPAPISLTAALADPASLPAAAGRSWGPRDEERVAAGTGCGDVARMRATLERHGGDVDAAVEALVEELGQEGEEEVVNEGPAPGTAGDAAGGGGGAMAASASTAVEQQPACRASQVGAGAPADGSSRSSGGGGGAQATDKQRSASGRQAAGVGVLEVSSTERVALRLHEAGEGPFTRVIVSLQIGAAAAVAAVAPDGSSGAAGGPGPGQPGTSSSDSEGEEEGGPHGCASAARAAQFAAAKKGVRVRGKGAAAVGGPTRRNKPCPCGSKLKWKNCCGRRGRAGSGTAAGGGSTNGVDTSTAAQVAQAQLQELLI